MLHCDCHTSLDWNPLNCRCQFVEMVVSAFLFEMLDCQSSRMDKSFQCWLGQQFEIRRHFYLQVVWVFWNPQSETWFLYFFSCEVSFFFFYFFRCSFLGLVLMKISKGEEMLGLYFTRKPIFIFRTFFFSSWGEISPDHLFMRFTWICWM